MPAPAAKPDAGLAAAAPRAPKARKPNRLETLFGICLGIYLILLFTAPGSDWTTLAQMAVVFLGLWLAIRVARAGVRKAIWRLRNRLLVTYLFIAVVPIVLIAMLAGISAWALTSQVAEFLVTSELNRRIDSLRSAALSVQQTEPAERAAVMETMADLFYSERFPGIELLLRESSAEFRYPEDSALQPPPKGWKPTSGVVRKGGRFYAWSYAQTATGDITILAPLTREFLDRLVPDLGLVYFGASLTNKPDAGKKVSGEPNPDVEIKALAPDTEARSRDRLPPPANRLDVDVLWFSQFPSSIWEDPNSITGFLLVVRSRPSAVLNTVFSGRVDLAHNFWPVALAILGIVFLIAEAVSLLIGASMTRTITGAVHRLYDGTQRVIEGDFAHRIEVQGDDQLADLSRSFNRMTENLERLLVVAKEKERLESEIEIAREVQNQLYPKVVPAVRTLKLTGVCHAARMVSGDYYDYESLSETKVALAIGDVAGKGISAALLMATLQSSMRAQLHGSLEAAATAHDCNSPIVSLSTSHLVSRLNLQLHATTSPEKYATFYFGVFDESTGLLTYTNAGHLPPILVSRGKASRLDVNGTVVGAFARAPYDESRVELRAGDLLVCFTDGISEPENAYGEMFGEDRLADLVCRNADRDDAHIVTTVMDAVEQWTGGGEQQDDMTILLARRL
jgi:sigma-B regulation protein RsbU (phosphoserine phosphatase)